MYLSFISPTHICVSHKDIGLPTNIYIGICYFPPFGAKTYKSTYIDYYTLLFTEFVSYQSLGEDFLSSDFHAHTAFY